MSGSQKMAISKKISLKRTEAGRMGTLLFGAWGRGRRGGGGVEACVAERLTPGSRGQGSSLACRIVSLDKKLYSFLSLFTQVYIWVSSRRHTAGG